MITEEQFKSQFRGKIVYPGDKDFGFPNAWNLFSQKAKPKCIAIPTDISDVQMAVNYCRENKIQLTVRSGGHTVFSVRDDALCLDMKLFKNVSVSDDGIVTCGTGLLLRELDEKTAPWHIPLGVVGHTGFGLLLGGGFGWLGRTYGTAIDNVIQIKVVTADGKLHTCSRSENEDLFWAMRGAGSNLGVAVEYTLQAHLIPNDLVFTSMLAWPLDANILEKLMKFLSDTFDQRRGTTYVSLLLGPDGSRLVAAQTMYLGDEEEGKVFIKPLFDLNPIIPMIPGVIMPFTAWNKQSDDMIKPAYWYMTGVSALSEPSRKTIDIIVEEFNKIPPAFPSMIAIEQKGGKIADFPSDETAHALRNQKYDIVAAYGWIDESQTNIMTDLVKSLKSRLSDSLDEAGSLAKGVYNNIGHTNNLRVRAQESYMGNLPRLIEIKKKYDPDNFFKGNVDLTV